jgi:CBS domain-containing membrane protein
MRKNDPINKLMSKNVESVQQGQALSDVYKLMCNTGIHHVPVLDGEKLTGLISFTDMMKLSMAIDTGNAHTVDALIDGHSSIVDVMSTNLITIKHQQTVRDAAEILSEGDFHSLPVVDNDGNIAGMLTSTDLIRYLSAQY